MNQQARHFYEFGPFHLEISDRMLLRDGEFVPLTPKTFETLRVLVESGGRVLDKEELLQRIWPDTFVEEVSLAKNISILRKTLGEDGSHPYIETIPRRGYRFVASVREVWQESPTQAVSDGTPAAQTEVRHPLDQPFTAGGSGPSTTIGSVARHRQMFGLRTISAIAVVMVGLAILAFWQWSLRPRAKSPGQLRVVPLTSFQGRESQAAFSPSGNQIAFTWDGPQGNNPDIYVKLLGDETPLRLTAHPAADSKPVWSPDGNNIAFLRQSADESAFYMVPALGGAERKLASISPYQVPSGGNSPYFSPDGKYLAIPDRHSPAEPMSIYLLSIETGEKRKITSPAAGNGDHYPAFSPDGRMLAFARIGSWSTSDLYVVPLSGGPPRRLTFDNLTLSGLSWTADSQEVVFSSKRGSSTLNLWKVPAGGGPPNRIETVGKDVVSPAVSLQGDRLAYTQTLDDVNIWRIELDESRFSRGATEWIASTFFDHGPDYSPDGSRIVFASGRSGGDGIWVCRWDGSTPRLLFDGGPYVTGTPRWSPDGRRIAFDSRFSSAGNPDIYLIDADGGQPRRLTTDPAEDVAPSWSRDGQFIYFGSTRSGRMEIWRISVSGGPATQITRHGGFECFESPDGRHVYYTKGRSLPGIWKMPRDGGPEVLVTDHHQAGLWRCWRVVDSGIYFASAASAGPRLEFFNFATRQISRVTRLSKGPHRHTPGLAVSPDGRSILYAQIDQSGSDLMLAGFCRHPVPHCCSKQLRQRS